MCQARVYLSRDGQEEEIMQDVILLESTSKSYGRENLLSLVEMAGTHRVNSKETESQHP